MSPGEPAVFALGASRDFGSRVAAGLGLPLAPHEEREFPDGEHVSRPLVNVRDRDAYVVHSLYADQTRSVHDKLCRLLFFAATLKDAGAARVTAVAPYLCYSREDRREREGEPVTTRYVAAQLEAAGVDRVLAVDVHDLAAFQNAFRIPAENVEAAPLFADHFAASLPAGEVAVISPDAGGIKRAERFRQRLADLLRRPVGSGYVTKQRIDGAVAGAATLVGPVSGTNVVIFDDMIATAGTVARAADACRAAGAAAVYAAATHGLFAGEAEAAVFAPALDGVVVTDTVPPFRLTSSAARAKLAVLDAAALVAGAVRRARDGRPPAGPTGG